MNKEELVRYFNDTVERINCPSFIENDPVQFPHRYHTLQDQEIAGLLTALISWGKREMILRNAEKMLSMLSQSPYEFIMEADYRSIEKGSIHRTFNSDDLIFLCKGLRVAYERFSSLESFFIDRDPFEGIQFLRETIIMANGLSHSRSEKHLANPQKDSACKRFHMFLRWMVRNDGIIDLGIWRKISPKDLYIPLDTHVMHVASYFGLLLRRSSDRKSVESLTAVLREFCPEDPIKYDFALFGLGIQGNLKS